MGKKGKLQLYEPGDRVLGKRAMAGEMGTVDLVEIFIADDNIRPIIVKWDDERYGKLHVHSGEIEFVSKASPQRSQRKR